MTFQHRAGVSPYTSPCGFARTCVFSKQSLPPALCGPSPQPARGLRGRAPLLPKLRGQFAEFLHHGSLARLGILCRTTCVGLGYGRPAPSRRGFSRHLRITLLSPAAPRRGHHHASPPPPRWGGQAPGFAWGPGCALERAKPSGPPGYHCASPLLTRLPTSTEDPQTTGHRPPGTPEGDPRTVSWPAAWVSTRASAWSVQGRYGNINPSSIDYACRPRLRSRLTQGGRTCPWNPWSLGAGDSHPGLATHACILAPAPSTRGSPPGFTQRRTLPYHPPPHLSRETGPRLRRRA